MSTETVAVDREALAEAILEGHDIHADSGREGCWANAQKIADYILNDYIPDVGTSLLRDAAAVRHEHGERIAKAIEAYRGPAAVAIHPVAHAAFTNCAKLARDLSLEPESKP